MVKTKMSPLNVLVVGDAHDCLLYGMIAGMGHRAAMVVDGAEALAKCEENLPDLLLIETALYAVDGFEMAREVRRRYESRVMILLLSDRTDELLEALRAGGDDLLLKPVNPEILQAKLRQIQVRVAEHKRLLDYRERIQEENETARDFIEHFTALNKISDPLVRFMLKPAENFSGDLIAVARGPDNSLHVLLADSAGHGLTAALAVIPITQPFYQMTARGFDIAAILRELNRRVREYLPLPRFVATAILSFNPETGIVQVWNGGLPNVLLIDAKGEEILHDFRSRHLPLGVLKPEEFEAGPEYFKLHGKPASLMLCSDGVTEIRTGDKLNLDHGGLLLGARQSSAVHLFDRVVEVIEEHLDEVPPEDDVALIVIDCPAVASKPAKKQLRFLIANASEEPADCSRSHDQQNLWEMSMLLSAAQLKSLDVVPFLLNIVRQIEGGGGSDGRLFLVLSDLFNNALDHGVLKLDSALKEGPEGMELYFEERAARLDALEEGSIAVRIERLECTSCGCLRITVKDSGDGFDYQTMLNPDVQDVSLRRHGRGLTLLNEMCGQFQYYGNGSEVVAYLSKVHAP